MRKISLFALALALAAGSFWSAILTDPPQSHAATAPVAQAPELGAADHCVAFGVCP